jgi:ABC-2 type transport system ATP-binding protein
LNTKSNYCIEVKNLHKYYDSNVHAIDNISFVVPYGQVFGFLGPNGAGKTTTLKILTTLVRPSSGTVKLFGKDILKNSRDIKKRIGIVLQRSSFESRLSVEKSLDMYGRLWGIDKDLRVSKIKELLEVFDLNDIIDATYEELSIGQRRRVQVAREFIHEMDLLFLDEPTVGLDPTARRLLLQYIKKKVTTGLTVFFTTHIMEEAEYLCDNIAIINRGNLVTNDTPQALKERFGGIQTLQVEVRNADSALIIPLIEKIDTPVHAVETLNNRILKIQSLNPHQVLIKLIEILSINGIQIERVEVTSSSLEEAFLSIVDNETSKSVSMSEKRLDSDPTPKS